MNQDLVRMNLSMPQELVTLLKESTDKGYTKSEIIRSAMQIVVENSLQLHQTKVKNAARTSFLVDKSLRDSFKTASIKAKVPVEEALRQGISHILLAEKVE